MYSNVCDSRINPPHSSTATIWMRPASRSLSNKVRGRGAGPPGRQKSARQDAFCMPSGQILRLMLTPRAPACEKLFPQACVIPNLPAVDAAGNDAAQDFDVGKGGLRSIHLFSAHRLGAEGARNRKAGHERRCARFFRGIRPGTMAVDGAAI